MLEHVGLSQKGDWLRAATAFDQAVLPSRPVPVPFLRQSRICCPDQVRPRCFCSRSPNKRTPTKRDVSPISTVIDLNRLTVNEFVPILGGTPGVLDGRAGWRAQEEHARRGLRACHPAQTKGTRHKRRKRTQARPENHDFETNPAPCFRSFKSFRNKSLQHFKRILSAIVAKSPIRRLAPGQKGRYRGVWPGRPVPVPRLATIPLESGLQEGLRTSCPGNAGILPATDSSGRDGTPAFPGRKTRAQPKAKENRSRI